MIYQPSISIGTVSAESVRILGIISPEKRGVVIPGADVFLAVAQPPHPTNYWLIELGTIDVGGEFFPRQIIARPKVGFCKGRNVVEFPVRVGYSTGDVVAVRVRPAGSPAALTGCDVVLRIQEA